MVKTSTSLNFFNFTEDSNFEKSEETVDMQNSQFLESLKSQLDRLKKEPSQACVQAILDYANVK